MEICNIRVILFDTLWVFFTLMFFSVSVKHQEINGKSHNALLNEL